MAEEEEEQQGGVQEARGQRQVGLWEPAGRHKEVQVGLKCMGEDSQGCLSATLLRQEEEEEEEEVLVQPRTAANVTEPWRH